MAEEEASNTKKKMIIILAIAVLIAIIGASSATYFLMSSDNNEEVVEEEVTLPDPPTFTEIRSDNRQAFITALETENGYRLMRVYVYVKTRTEASKLAVDLHLPRIVSKFNSIFSAQKFEDIINYDQKVELKDLAKKSVNSIIQESDPEAYVEEVLFTDLVIQ